MGTGWGSGNRIGEQGGGWDYGPAGSRLSLRWPQGSPMGQVTAVIFFLLVAEAPSPLACPSQRTCARFSPRSPASATAPRTTATTGPSWRSPPRPPWTTRRWGAAPPHAICTIHVPPESRHLLRAPAPFEPPASCRTASQWFKLCRDTGIVSAALVGGAKPQQAEGLKLTSTDVDIFFTMVTGRGPRCNGRARIGGRPTNMPQHAISSQNRGRCIWRTPQDARVHIQHLADASRPPSHLQATCAAAMLPK